MRKLPLPSDENGNVYDAGEVFSRCIARIRNADLRSRLASVKEKVSASASEFDEAARNAKTYTLSRGDDLDGIVTDAEMVAVYDDRMVKNSGRDVYDRIFLADRTPVCPLCGVLEPKTLDHYLPKAHYPTLTVAPNNLVPACYSCQNAKMDAFPASAGDQTFHPYFDDFESRLWLNGEVVETAPAAILFSVGIVPDWDEMKIERAKSHLAQFGLYHRYAVYAASELGEIRHLLRDLLQRGGESEVRQYLERKARSAAAFRLNYWKTALYSATARSSWYCRGGFDL